MKRWAIIIIIATAWAWLMVRGWEKKLAAEDEATIPQSSSRAVCTYYSWPEHGRQTASGEIYDSLSLTCASLEKIPFGTMIRFINPDNGREVVCRVNDRMPSKYWDTDRRFDLSKKAADILGIVKEGKRELIIY